MYSSLLSLNVIINISLYNHCIIFVFLNLQLPFNRYIVSSQYDIFNRYIVSSQYDIFNRYIVSSQYDIFNRYIVSSQYDICIYLGCTFNG
jgi:hypothetical protein